MQPKYLTLKQLTNIIENGFVGKHDRYGNQVDYHDYKDEILARYWELTDRETKKQFARIEENLDGLQELNAIEVIFDEANALNSLTPLEHAKIFNKFRYIAQCIEINRY